MRVGPSHLFARGRLGTRGHSPPIASCKATDRSNGGASPVPRTRDRFGFYGFPRSGSTHRRLPARNSHEMEAPKREMDTLDVPNDM